MGACGTVAWQACQLTELLVFTRGCDSPPPQPHPPPPTHTLGVSLATGLHMGDLSSWAQLASRDALIKLAPALAMVLLITAVLHRVRCGGWRGMVLKGFVTACEIKSP